MTDAPEPDKVVRLDAVRARLAAAEDVDMGGVPAAGEGGEGGPDGDGYADEGDGAGLPPAPPDDEQEGPPAARCARLPLNDVGNGGRFAIHFGEDLLHVPRVGWFTWPGRVWARDPDGLEVRRRAQRLGELILDEVAHVHPGPDEAALLERAEEIAAERARLMAVAPGERMEDQRAGVAEADRRLAAIAAIRDRLAKRAANLRSHARGSGNSPKVKAAIEQSETRLSRPLEALDADPLVVNTESGALRFEVEEFAGEGMPLARYAKVALEPHDRAQLLTKMVPVTWDPTAECPLFDAFLARVQPDPAMRGFLQRWFGLSLTGLTGEQKLVFLYGGGANGKSVLVDLMARLMGDYAATAKVESLTGRNRRSGGDATPDLVPLIGARMVRASEPEEGERLQEGRIKELTGGEPILVRALNEDFIEVRPIFKLTISGNHKPDVRGTDDGIWRRLLLVPFLVQIPKGERDPRLGEKLWAERAGILQWAAQGLLEYLERGLREPPSVLEATAEYREESDPLGGFLTEACVVTGVPSDAVRTAELVRAFNYWLVERGQSQWKETTVAKQLPAKAQHWRHPRSGLAMTKGKSNLSQYQGLRLTDVFRARFEAAPRDQAGRITGAAAYVDDDLGRSF